MIPLAKKLLHRSSYLVILLLLAAPTPSRPPGRPDLHDRPAHKVDRVVDGDTVDVIINGKKQRIRLIGVDTPETVHPTKPVEAFGKEASEFTRRLLKGKEVWVVADPEGDTRDRYGRTLAHLYRSPDGLWINLEIIRQGYGHAYTRFPFKHRSLFKNAEREARLNKRGLWQDDDSTTGTLSKRETKETGAPGRN